MKNVNLSPILLFVYKRLDTLENAVTALKQNSLAKESELFIFSDAAKTPKDEKEINDVRSFIKKIDGFKNIYTFEANKNKGLAQSVIDGVSHVIKQYGKVIVLEDDLVTSPNFLSYMNQSLEFYQNNSKVFSVAGYTIPITLPADYKYDSYFLPRASSWGWATWKDRWDDVDWKVSTFAEFTKDKKQIKAFNSGGSDMYQMLKKQINGKLDSWAIRWCYHQFRQGSYTLFPVVSKIKNIGFSNMATNTYVFNRYDTKLDEEAKTNFLFPAKVEPNATLLSQFQSFYSLRTRAIGKIKTYLYRVGLYTNK